MHARRAGLLAAVAATALAALVAVAGAAAQPTTAAPSIVVENGLTQPVFGYADAIRERVYVQSDFDSDLDGVADTIAMDIMRPKATEDGLRVPVIMDASPYYTTLGRGNEAERIEDVDGDGIVDRFPLFYDNYFVPRGYAMVLLHMVGTGFSDGCPVTGGTPDKLSGKVGIDWLNGRIPGTDHLGGAALADWHNGKTGMIGKSYDGTLANGVASTGVEGLSTIVPISAISSWYDYSRSNGIRFNTNYPASLSNTVTNASRRAHCAEVRSILSATDGDETGDYTEFWVERDYNKDAKNVRSSVFVVHGLQDNNVKADHFSKWWYALPSHVQKKLWLTRTGHIDPFDFRRADWVDELHKWFDHELQGVKNDILKEPRVDIEYAADEWREFDTWPVKDSKPVELRFAENTPETPGVLGYGPPLAPVVEPVFQTFVDTPSMSEANAISNPQNVTANRRVFLSPELTAPVHVSGTPIVRLRASVNDTFTNLAAILVDYGTKEQVSRTGDGILTVSEETCWGEARDVDDACYRETVKRIQTASQWQVTKGILDARNRNSLSVQEDLVPGEEYSFEFPLLPQDYIFEPGHRIGIVVLGSFSGYGSIAVQNRATITLNLNDTTVELPVVGGKRTLELAGLAKQTPPLGD